MSPEVLARAAIDAVPPRRCTREALERLVHPAASPTLFAFGKAARAMAEGALDLFPDAKGHVVCGAPSPLGRLLVHHGSHPFPSPDAAQVGALVLRGARGLGAGDTAIVLVSGGGSSMLELPLPGLTIADLEATSRALMHAGADIAALNTIRGALSQLKAGGLARALAPARTIAVVLSDTPGHPPTLVASGPCSAPASAEPIASILARLRVRDALPEAVRNALDAARPPPPTPAVELLVAADVHTAVAGAVAAARASGRRLGTSPRLLRGEARLEAVRFVQEARAACVAGGLDGWVSGGETTVTVHGDGRGGRCAEAALALAAAGTLSPSERFVAIATDGVDGSGDGAAFWMDPSVLRAGRALGLAPATLLARSDSDAWFAATSARLVTGPTGTNVADVWVYLRDC